VGNDMTLKDLSVCIVICHPYPETKGGEERFLKHFSNFLEDSHINYTIVSSIPKCNTPNIFGVGISPFRLPLVGFTPYFLLFSFIAGMRIILMNKHRSFSLIHSIDTGYSGLAGLYASKILGLKFIAHSHCCRASALRLIVLLRNGIAKHFISPFSKFESSIDELVSRNADHLIVVNKEIKQYISNLGVPFEKISVIPMGIESSCFKLGPKDREEVRQEFGIPENAFVIGYIGRIETPNKRVHTLIEAFSIFNHRTCTNSYLMIVGNGNHNKYDDKVKKMGVTSLIFTGFRQDVERMLAALDVFVLPSLSEGCPFSLLEAMAAEKTIAASDIPSIREIVENGKEALLFDPKDVNTLEKALSRLYDESDLRIKLAKEARNKVRHYEKNHILTRILEIYEKID
jgi:glycosyltransferase involved in cell wall biosynthesis